MASAPFRTDPRLLRPEDVAALQELERLRLARGLPGIGQELRDFVSKLTPPPEEQKPAIVAPPGAIVLDLDPLPFCPHGWTIESHRPGGHFVWDPAKVRLHLEPEQTGEGSIEGTELLKRPATASAFNANLLDGLLEHPELIPESWKEEAVFFWGTVYRDAEGLRHVRYLHWIAGKWSSDYCKRLRNRWGLRHPAALPASI